MFNSTFLVFGRWNRGNLSSHVRLCLEFRDGAKLVLTNVIHLFDIAFFVAGFLFGIDALCWNKRLIENAVWNIGRTRQFLCWSINSSVIVRLFDCFWLNQFLKFSFQELIAIYFVIFLCTLPLILCPPIYHPKIVCRNMTKYVMLNPNYNLHPPRLLCKTTTWINRSLQPFLFKFCIANHYQIFSTCSVPLNLTTTSKVI